MSLLSSPKQQGFILGIYKCMLIYWTRAGRQYAPPIFGAACAGACCASLTKTRPFSHDGNTQGSTSRSSDGLSADVEDGFTLHLVERAAAPPNPGPPQPGEQAHQRQSQRISVNMVDAEGVMPVSYVSTEPTFSSQTGMI